MLGVLLTQQPQPGLQEPPLPQEPLHMLGALLTQRPLLMQGAPAQSSGRSASHQRTPRPVVSSSPGESRGPEVTFLSSRQTLPLVAATACGSEGRFRA